MITFHFLVLASKFEG